MVSLLTLLSVSWNLLAGFTGYISFGHSAFFAVGSYAVALSTGMPYWLRLIGSGVIASAVGSLFTLPSLRFRGFVFAMVTLGLSEIMYVLALHGGSFTGGPHGVGVPFGGSQQDVLVMLGIATCLVTMVAVVIPGTDFGRALVALRNDEIAASSVGVNVVLCKFVMFVISAFSTGIAGGIYALWLGYVEPTDVFSTARLVAVLAANLLGGLTVPLGPFFGAVLVGILQEFTWVRSPFLHQAFFGSIILGFALLLPKGLLGALYERRSAQLAARVVDLLKADSGDGGISSPVSSARP
jgi:branched-chain amino acid transport system permease protein